LLFRQQGKKKLLNSDEEPIMYGCNVDLRGMFMWILRYLCCTSDQ